MFNIEVGTSVYVEADSEGEFHEFVGTVLEINGTSVLVEDQEEQAWTVDIKNISKY
jgi:ribosome maturation factor RimP